MGTSITKLTSGIARLGVRGDAGGTFEDRIHRVEPTLGVGAGHQRVARRVTVAGHRLIPVGGELGVAEPLEDLASSPHPGRDRRGHGGGSLRRPRRSRPGDLRAPPPPCGGRRQVGEHLPPSHGDAELVMRQLRRVVDHHLGHIHQLCSAARVGERPPQLVGLGDTDLTRHHRIAEPVTARDQVGGADPIPTLGIGPAAQRPTPPVDVAVPIPRCTPRSLTAPITAANAPSVRRRSRSSRLNNSASSRPSRPSKVSTSRSRDRPTRRPRASSHSSETSDHNGH